MNDVIHVDEQKFFADLKNGYTQIKKYEKSRHQA